jgi:intracellular multiplication protein IcmF
MKDKTCSEVENLKNNLAQLSINEKKHPLHVGLLLGPHDAGKTSLMGQTDLIFTQTISTQGIECNTWSNKDAIFIEAPESVVLDDERLTQYIKTIIKFRRKKCLDSINLCLNVHDSMLQAPIAFIQQLIGIKKRLAVITKITGKTRLFIIFTHMDKIAGFCHSFQEIDDAYGYNFSPCPNKESLIKQNDKHYTALVKNLHLTLIPRLHDTKDGLTRYLIREFPLQMESLSNMIRACINQTFDEKLNISGIFFTSAKQGNSAHDRLSANITNTYALSVSSSVPQSSRDTSFFVSGCIKKIIAYRATNQNILLSKYTIAASATCFVIGLALTAHHFRNNYLLNQAGQELFIYNHSQADNLAEVTNALEHLTNAENAVSDLSKVVPLTHLSSFQKHVNKQYSKGLKNNFLNIISKQLEQVLSQKLNPTQSYHTLKAYLMLGSEQHMDKHYLSKWLNDFWKKNQFSERPRLNKLLQLAIKKPFKGIRLNQSVISNIRSYLTALPEEYLYYSLFSASINNPKSTQQFHFFTLKNINTPYVFQKKHFKITYNQLAYKFGKQLELDSFVLDKKTTQSKVDVLRREYLERYANWWVKISQTAMPLTFQTYAQAKDFFTHLASPNSSFEKIRQLIQFNTGTYSSSQAKDELAFNRVVARKFTSFNLFTAHQSKLLQPIFADFTYYFETLNNAQDEGKTAFSVAKSRFNNHQVDPISQLHRLEQQLPFPLNDWVIKIGNNAWNLILQDTQNHINEQWQSLVYNEYEDTIKGNFPFHTKASKEVSKSNFIHFFGHQGRLAQFFDYYLKPFIDTSSARWRVKELDGLQLPIHKKTMTELIRANVIREMFFDQNSDVPDVSFTLHAIALEPIVKTFTVAINGQKLIEEQDQQHSLEFKWPGNNENQLTQLIVNSISGQMYKVDEEGFWGLFKLFSKANLIAVNNDTQNYQLILDVNGNAAKFLLSANKPLNPFIPGILDDFRLPRELA